MANVLIVDAISTGQNYIFDILETGHTPVVMYSKMNKEANPLLFVERKELANKYSKYAKYYDEQDTFEKTLELAKKINPIFVLPGTEEGVPLATKISDALALPGNKANRIEFFTHKDKMQEALKDYGIRYLRGKIVHSVEEALDFYKSEEFTSCIIKPVCSAGSVGIHLCDNIRDLEEYIKKELNTIGIFGQVNDGVLVQERVIGTEYIVNTVSFEGQHYLTSMWKYKRKKEKGGGNVHDLAINLSKFEVGSTKLVKYAFDVCDALQIDYGACHAEFMIDSKGPALIEVNCRPMGGSMPTNFLKSIWGHHETNLVLKSYLNHKKMYHAYSSHSQKYSNAMIKFIISPLTSNYYSVPLINIAKHLKSYVSISITTGDKQKVDRTIDLETSPALLYLQNKNELVLNKEVEFLKKVEENYFGMFFEVEKVNESDKPKKMLSLDEVIENYCKYDNKLILTNTKKPDIDNDIVDIQTIKDVKEKYDVGIFDLEYTGKRNLEDVIESFYYLSKRVHSGAKIIVPKRAFWYMPYGFEFFEMLCEWRDFDVSPSNALNQEIFVAKKSHN